MTKMGKKLPINPFSILALIFITSLQVMAGNHIQNTSQATASDIARKSLKQGCPLDSYPVLDQLENLETRARIQFMAGDYEEALKTAVLMISNERKPSLSLLGLGAAIAFSARDLILFNQWLDQGHKIDPHAHWISVEKLRGINPLTDSRIHQACHHESLSSPLLIECARMVNHMSPEKNNYFKRALEASEKNRDDPFSHIYAAKAYEGLGQVKKALKRLSKVSPDSPAQTAALREMVRIHGDLNQTKKAEISLKKLLHTGSKDSINHEIAFELYKKLNRPFKASLHLQKMKTCISPKWNQWNRLEGYQDQAIGWRIGKKSAVKSEFFITRSLYNAFEILQNTLQNQDPNLYNFQTKGIHVEASRVLSKNNTGTIKLLTSSRSNPVSEIDLGGQLGIVHNHKTDGIYQWTQSLKGQLINVYDSNSYQFKRNLFEIQHSVQSNTTNTLRQNRISAQFHHKYGMERQFRTSNAVDFYEYSLTAQKEWFQSQWKVFGELRGKHILTAPRWTALFATVGLEKQWTSVLRTQVYSKTLILPENHALALENRAHISFQLNNSQRLNFSWTGQRDIALGQYHQDQWEAGSHAHFDFGGFRIKTQVTWIHQRNFGQISNQENIFTVKVGTP